MRFLLLVLVVFGITGCTKGSSPVCEVAKTISTGVADEVAKQLDCKAPAAIKATIDQKLVDLKVCAISSSSLIGDMICGPLVNGLMTSIQSKIPSEWKCSGGTIKDELRAVLISTCRSSI